MTFLPEKKEASFLRFYDRTRCSKVLNPSPYQLHCSTKFPRLVLPMKSSRQAINGVVRLDTKCERKYRPLTHPTGYYTGDVLYYHTAECNSNKNDRNYTNWAALPQLGSEVPSKCTKAKNFDVKSFCDSISTLPCSSVSRTSACSSVVEDERLVCISKPKSVLNWIQSLKKELQIRK